MPESIKKVTEDYTVNVEVPTYVEKLQNVIKNTPARVQANFLMMAVVVAKFGSTNKDARNIFNKALEAMNGRKEEPARWKTCILLVPGELKQQEKHET